MDSVTARQGALILMTVTLATIAVAAGADATGSAAGAATEPEAPASPVASDREPKPARRDFIIERHRPNYLLFYSYVHDPNAAPFLQTDPEADWQHQEIKFQISLRVPLRKDLIGKKGDRFGNNLDAWFGYTQQSFWQAYYFDRSAPFRESNYEPELGLTYRGADTSGSTAASLFHLGELAVPAVSAGFAHQSNGGSKPLSRSWNRLWLQLDTTYGRNWSFKLKPWFRIREAKADDDNPEIQEYVGRAEFLAVFKIGEHQLSALWRNNLRARNNRSGYQLDWTFPFFWGGRFKTLVHFYNGFGESLVDHDVRVRRIGIGALVNDWR
jgi:phospholipase A1